MSILPMSDKITYIFQNVEVVLTNRTATRKIQSTRTKQDTIDILYEITPLDPMNGTWKKWCRLEELYQIGEK